MTNEDLGPLAATANRAAQWTATAGHLKTRLSRARVTTFCLTIFGATAATIAGQIPGEGTLRNSFVAVGTVALALATFVAARLLTTERVGSWAKVRAAAEALKREAFRYAARARPYDDLATAPGLLDTERQKIDADLGTVLPVDAKTVGSAPQEMMTPDEYRKKRVRDQIDWYQSKSKEAGRSAGRLRLAEFILAALATVITALSTITGKQIPLVGINFDIAALTALFTTVGGAILSHVEASRLDDLATNYAAAARRLEDLDAGFNRAKGHPQNWSVFVNSCEDIIAAENQSWIAKWDAASAP
jgi:conflict system pore-forming effector with SLATT domain/uncharacterized protein DUF4231